MNTPPKTSDGAICSMILGIVSFLGLGPLTAIPAIVFGHIARKRIAQSEGRLTGGGMALAGLLLGYVATSCFILMGAIIASDYLASERPTHVSHVISIQTTQQGAKKP